MGLAVGTAETGHPSALTPTSDGPAVLLISTFDLGHQPGRAEAAGRPERGPTSVLAPQLSEPWYRCAEPLESQLAPHL